MAQSLDEFIAQRKAAGTTAAPAPTKGTDVMDFIKQRQSGEAPTTEKRILAPSKLLRTEAGLTITARRAGLEEDTARILKGKGEDPNKYYSGGFVSDIFDTLNTLQYGVVGVVKGKTFAEGVSSRESFSDQDALGKFGLPGTLAGIALDIAFDPLTYIPVVGLAKASTKIGAVAKAVKGAKVAQESVAASKVGQFFGSRFIYRFGQDPLYRMMDERRIKAIGVGVQNMMDLVRPISKLDSEAQRVIGAARKAGTLSSLPRELLVKAQPAFDALDDLGKQAVEAGLLKQETWEENVGSYMARLYRKHEAPEGAAEAVAKLFPSKPMRIDTTRFMKRTDIPEDVRTAMGEILEAGYPTAKALVQLKNAVENKKFFDLVANRWGDMFTKNSAEAIGKGLVQLDNTPRLGNLAGNWVPKPIALSLNEIVRSPTASQKVQQKVVGGFKFAKVILNPATHARNIASNIVLNYWEGMNPLDPRAMKAYGTAGKELAQLATGNPGKWYQEARQAGLGLDNFAANEIRGFLEAPEVNKLGAAVKGAMTKLADLYQKEEEFAKLSMYIFQREAKKLPAEEAWKIAERATFNYAQVTPFIRQVREAIWGYPFITFAYKATPQAIKTGFTKPTRISNIGKIKNAIENAANQQELTAERASEPDWVRDGFYVKLPIKDKDGRSSYLDLTYILPFGDLVSGQFWERGINRETGLPEGAVAAQVKKLPFINAITELAKNQDFYGNKIFQDSDPNPQQLADMFLYLVRLYSPPLVGDQLEGGYRADGTKRPPVRERVAAQEKGLEEGGMQSRTRMQELLRSVGVKINPIDLAVQEQWAEKERMRALLTLLKENGIISGFEIPFTPKR